MDASDFNWNLATSLEDGIQKLKANVLAVSFRDVRINNNGVREVADALAADSCNCKGLILFNTGMTDNGAEYLARCLETNSKVSYLSIGRNVLTNKSMIRFAELLEHHNKSLLTLSLMFVMGIDDRIKNGIVFNTYRNRILKMSGGENSGNVLYTWSGQTSKLYTAEPKIFFSYIYKAIKIHGLNRVENRNALIDLFKRTEDRLFQGRSMLDAFLRAKAVSDVVDYAELAVLLCDSDLLTSGSHYCLHAGYSIFNVLFGTSSVSSEDMLEAVKIVGTRFDISTKNVQGEGLIFWLNSNIRQNHISVDCCSGIISFWFKEKGLVLSQSETDLLICSVLNRGGDENSIISCLDSIYACGTPVISLKNVKDTLINSVRSMKLEIKTSAKVVKWFKDNGTVPKLFFTPEQSGKSILFVVLDSEVRGEILFSTVKLLFDAGCNLHARNLHTKTVLDYLLCGPPHTSFSHFGQAKGKNEWVNNKHHLRHNVVRSLSRQLKPDSPKRSLVDLPKNYTISGVRSKVRQHFNSRNHQSPGQSMNVGKHQEHPGVRDFDSRSYASFILWANENGIIEIETVRVSNAKYNILEFVFRSCNSGDKGLFKAVETICDHAGLDLNIKNKKGECIIDWMLRSPGINSETFSRFISWLSIKEEFDANSRMVNGETFLEAVISSRLLEEKLEYVKMIVHAGFSIETTNYANEGVLDWILRNLESNGMHSPVIKPLQCAKIISWLTSQRQLNLDVNANTKTGRTIVDALIGWRDIFSEDKLNDESQLLQALDIIIQNTEYDINRRNALGESTIDWIIRACDKSYISILASAQILQLAHNKGFNVNTKPFPVNTDASNDVPLLEAVIKHYDENMFATVQILKEVGYDFSVRNGKNENVFTWILEKLDWEKVNIFDIARVMELIYENDNKEETNIDEHVNKDTKRRIFMKVFRHQHQCTKGDFLKALKILCEKCGFDVDETDNNGRIFRTLLKNHDEHAIMEWARTADCFDERYKLEGGAPVHQSSSCKVVYAEDVLTSKKVAIKIMKSKKAFQTELRTRKILRGTSHEKAPVKSKKTFLKSLRNFSSHNDSIRPEEVVSKFESDIAFDEEEYSRHVMDYLVDTTENEKLYVVMNRADRSLFDVINTERFAGRDFKKIQHISQMAAASLKFMNDKGVIHGDFKPRNYMRTDYRTDEWKLIDLDASVKHGHRIEPEKCSSAYCPPELAKYLFTFDTEVAPIARESHDVWSFGVVLYEMLTGTPLFLRDQTDDALYTNDSKAELVNWLSIDHVRLNRILSLAEGNLNEEIFEIIKQGQSLVGVCLQLDPSKRPSFREILQHEFYASSTSKFNFPETNESNWNHARLFAGELPELPPRTIRGEQISSPLAVKSFEGSTNLNVSDSPQTPSKPSSRTTQDLEVVVSHSEKNRLQSHGLGKEEENEMEPLNEMESLESMELTENEPGFLSRTTSKIVQGLKAFFEDDNQGDSETEEKSDDSASDPTFFEDNTFSIRVKSERKSVKSSNAASEDYEFAGVLNGDLTDHDTLAISPSSYSPDSEDYPAASNWRRLSSKEMKSALRRISIKSFGKGGSLELTKKKRRSKNDMKYKLDRTGYLTNRTHLFLSYMQKEASGIVKDVHYGLGELGCSSWLDMRAKRITEDGMFKGILKSEVFVMVLTKDALFRPFCVKELIWAMQFNMDIIFVVEVDTRFDAWKPDVFWKRWNCDGNDDYSFESLLDGLGEFETLSIERRMAQKPNQPFKPNHVQLDFNRARKQPNPVEFMLKNDLESLLKKLTRPKKIIPYRRREYENKAMCQHIMTKAGLVPPNLIKPTNPLDMVKKPRMVDGLSILVLTPPKESSRRSKESMESLIAPEISKYIDIGNANWVEISPIDVNDKDSDDSVLMRKLPPRVDILISLMTPGFFSHHKDLIKELFSRKTNPSSGKSSGNWARFSKRYPSIIAIQDGWFAQGIESINREKACIPSRIYEKFVMDTELMPYRPKHLREYEFDAMMKELCQRIKEVNAFVKNKISSN